MNMFLKLNGKATNPPATKKKKEKRKAKAKNIEISFELWEWWSDIYQIQGGESRQISISVLNRGSLGLRTKNTLTVGQYIRFFMRITI